VRGAHPTNRLSAPHPGEEHDPVAALLLVVTNQGVDLTLLQSDVGVSVSGGTRESLVADQAVVLVASLVDLERDAPVRAVVLHELPHARESGACVDVDGSVESVAELLLRP
jgi:chaperone required for assembly of F1-ATPase